MHIVPSHLARLWTEPKAPHQVRQYCRTVDKDVLQITPERRVPEPPEDLEYVVEVFVDEPAAQFIGISHIDCCAGSQEARQWAACHHRRVGRLRTTSAPLERPGRRRSLPKVLKCSFCLPHVNLLGSSSTNFYWHAFASNPSDSSLPFGF
jgi:hypothetical protein